MSNFWRYILILLSASVVLVFVGSFALFDDRLHLVFCDVGQGDAILIYRGSTQVLVDGGPDRSVLSCLSRHMPFWDRKIEALVLTNPDLDHYGGLVEIVRRYQIGSFLTSGVRKESEGVKLLERELEMRDVRVVGVGAGHKITLGRVSFLALWPTAEYLAPLRPTPPEATRDFAGQAQGVLGARTIKDSPNEFSLVLGLSYGQFDALLTGDIVPPVTNRVADAVREMGVMGEMRGPTSLKELRGVKWEVLKVPHHGSKNGLTVELLEVVNPKLAVISVGKKNRYGHPARETLDLLENKGVKVLRTDLDGEVEVVTDEREWGLWGR